MTKPRLNIVVARRTIKAIDCFPETKLKRNAHNGTTANIEARKKIEVDRNSS